VAECSLEPDDDDCISFALSIAKNNSSVESCGEDILAVRVSTPGKFSQSECDLKIEMQLYQVGLPLKHSHLNMSMYLFQVDRENATVDKNFDVLQFWEGNKFVYPSLYVIATVILVVPATSAPCERVFSRAARVLCKNRHRLTNKRLRSEIFFKFNHDLFVD